MHLHKKIYTRLNLMAALLALALVPNGCGSGSAPPGGPVPVPEVAAITIQPQRVELTTELPGRTSPFLVAEIRPQVNGIIKKRQFREGSDVKAGQLLYQIDPAPFQVALDSAKASLGKAQANLPSLKLKAERCRELVSEKAVSKQDYDDAAAAMRQAQSEIEYWQTAVQGAAINLGYTRVTAPISGRIGRSSVTDGALVTAYQATSLATIQQLDPIYVDVTQSTTELLRLKRSLESGRLCADGKNCRKVRDSPGRRHHLSTGRDPAIPGCDSGPGDRLVHLADRDPESPARAVAGHVCAGGPAGGHRGSGHPGPAARGAAHSQG